MGGLQSGYARQYNPDEAFTVYLGGHLVGNLKFTIPDARLILHDLRQWLVNHEFYFNFSGTAKPVKKPAHPVSEYLVAIISENMTDDSEQRFSYCAKGILTDESIDFLGHQVRQVRFTKSSIVPGKSEPVPNSVESYRVLNISILRSRFLSLLEQSKIRV